MPTVTGPPPPAGGELLASFREVETGFDDKPRRTPPLPPLRLEWLDVMKLPRPE
jgi:hypothetical protein